MSRSAGRQAAVERKGKGEQGVSRLSGPSMTAEPGRQRLARDVRGPRSRPGAEESHGHRFGAVAVRPPGSRPRVTTTEFHSYIGEKHSASRMGFRMAWADGTGPVVDERPAAPEEAEETGQAGAGATAGEQVRDFDTELRMPALGWNDPIAARLHMTKKAPTRGGITVPTTDFGRMEAEIRHPDTGVPKRVRIRVTTQPLLFIGVLFSVDAHFDVHFNWDTQSLGRTDVSGPHDPAVTAFTKDQIVSDLTPPETLPARPPRRHYWASDITRDHELFHARDSGDAYTRAQANQVSWLNVQDAHTDAEAAAHAATAVDNMTREVNVYMGAGNSSPAEIRAYNRDAPIYRKRAQDIANFRALRRQRRREERRQRRDERRQRREERRQGRGRGEAPAAE